MNQEQLSKKIEKIATQLELRHLTVVDFLLHISENTGITSRNLIRELGLPQTQLYKLINGFTDIVDPAKKQTIEIDGQLTDQIRNRVKLIKEEYSVDSGRIEQIFRRYVKRRPLPDRDLDQFPATPETSIKRAVEMAQNGDLKNRSVAFLGDDDLTSVTTALTSQVKEIFVFEIDQRLIDLIKIISEENNLNISIIKQDLRQPIPKQFHGRFDTIFTDPPYTPRGISTFINKAISLINPRLLSRIYLCYGNSDRARERELEIQKILTDCNLLIKGKINQFNKYYGAESIGSSSSLYVLDWTPKTKALRLDHKKIYTNE